MDADEKRTLRETIAAALWEEYDHGDEPYVFSSYNLADAVLDTLGLEPVGWWCPRHGDALCPEHYMLMADGTVALGYSMYWSENLRCGRREHTYRVAASGRVTEGKGTP